MTKSFVPQDYNKYSFRIGEWFFYLAQGILIVAALAYFFYQSFLAFWLLIPLVVLFMKKKAEELAKKAQRELNLQFKDMILSVSANQKAGYSVENAVRESYKDMELLYGRESMICKEILHIVRGLDNNIPLEKLLYGLGVRSHQMDMMQFADVFLIAKRNGGNMTDILRKTAETIEQKIDTDREIQVMLSAKKLEQKIMNGVPLFIIFYISSTSRGFFDVLYHNPAGILVMTICLCVYALAFCLSRRIVEIEV